MTTLRTDLIPAEPDTADWQPMIREALAGNGGHLRALATHDAITLDLRYCAYPDGTPIWDKPIHGHGGMIIATRADGHTIEIPTDDAHDWDTLASRLDGVMAGWGQEVMVTLSELVDTDRKIRDMETRLRDLKVARKSRAMDAHRLGVKPWTMHKATGRALTSVLVWLK